MDGKSCAGGYTLMCRVRRIVSDEVWERYAPYLPSRRTGAWGGSYPKYDNRTVLEAVLWIARAGSPLARPAGGVRQLGYHIAEAVLDGSIAMNDLSPGVQRRIRGLLRRTNRLFAIAAV